MNLRHKNKFQMLFEYFTFSGWHARAKICFIVQEQSSSSNSSSRESMFVWPFSLLRIPSWKHSGLGSWDGSWQTPNNKYLLYKQHARQFLHMNTWHSHRGWERMRSSMRPRGSQWYPTAPEEGSDVKVINRFSCTEAVSKLSSYLNLLVRVKCSFTGWKGARGVDSGLLCVSKVVSTLGATSHLSASP